VSEVVGLIFYQGSLLLSLRDVQMFWVFQNFHHPIEKEHLMRHECINTSLNYEVY